MSPTFGVASETAFAIARSLWSGVTKALEESLPVFGSVVDVEPVAVFGMIEFGPVDDEGANTVAVIVKVSDAPSGMSPTDQTPVVGL